MRSFIPDAEIILKALKKYHEESSGARKPVINQPPLEKIVEDLKLATFIRDGGLTGEALSVFLGKYLDTTTRLHHPSFMAHQVAVPHWAGSLGSLIDGFTNNGMAINEMGPGATSIEYFLINWFLEKVGWVPTPYPTVMRSQFQHSGSRSDGKQHANGSLQCGGGVLTHGGSLANLTALIVARNRIAPEAWRKGSPGTLAILAPEISHYCIARAAGIMGIGRNAIYHPDTDRRGVIIPDRLPLTYERLKKDGKQAMALVANACNTPVGTYDPLDEIGDFCRENDIWLHVDGAHGASALLSEKYRARMTGIEKADSLVWDAHKLMRTPTLCAALLVRDRRHLDSAFKDEASYIFHEKEQPGFDFLHRTIECTKAGLSLRLFMVLGTLGEKGLADYIEKQYDLALRAHEHIVGQKDFECPVVPESNIVCFRIEGSDQRQLRIREQLLSGGDFYLSTTLFNGKRYLRIVLMNPDTTLDVVEKLIQKVRDINATLDE